MVLDNFHFTCCMILKKSVLLIYLTLVHDTETTYETT